MVSLEKGFEVISDHRKGDGPSLVGELDLNSADYDEDEGRSRSLYMYDECKVDIELQNNNFCSPSSHVKEKTLTSEMETQISAPSEFPSTADAHQGEEMENNSDVDKLASPPHIVEGKELISNEEKRHVCNISEYEQEEKAINYKTEKVFTSSRLHCVDKETKIENVCFLRNFTTESEKLDVLHSDQDSPHGSPEHSIPPLTLRKTSVSPGWSPCTHQFPSGEKPFSAEGAHEPSHSPRSHRQKHFSLSEKSNLHEGVISHDQLPTSVMQTFTSCQGSPEGSKHEGDSSLKPVDGRIGSRTNYTPPKHQRKERSVSTSPVRRRDSRSPVRRRDSRSPVRRRDSRSPSRQGNCQSPVRRRDVWSPVRRRDALSPVRRRGARSLVGQRDSRPPVRLRHSRSPVRRRDALSPVKRRYSRSPFRPRDSSSGYRIDYHNRSRSRSPYLGDRHRRSPGRYSPRRRSPAGYHSRRRSPRRRPWSPPSNRSTGFGKPGKILFVAGFSFLTTERDLERKFTKFGHVRDVRIVRDKRSGDSRGFGFLSMRKDEEADAAIRALDETEWNGRIILVEKSKTSGQ